MAGSFVVSNGNTTIKLEYTAVTARVVDTCTSAAKYLWEHGYGNHGTQENPIAFDNLTNAQKLALIDQHVLHSIRAIAETQNVIDQVEAARAVALAETGTKFI